MTLNHLLPTLSWLTSITSRFTRTTAEAEDCAIIALERIAPRLEDFQTEEQAKAFLAKTARNAAIDASKAAQRLAGHEKASEKWWEGNEESVISAIRLRLVLECGIPTLQPKQQAMARLFLEGRSFDEVAQVMRMTRKSVVNQHGLIIKDLKRWVKRGRLQ